MQEEYVKEQIIIEKTEEEKRKELLKNIIQVKEDLKSANINFDYADPELIDYYAYKIKAGQSKLDCLIKEAKSRGLVLDMINALEIKEKLENNEVG